MGVIWGIPDTEAKFILVFTHQFNQQKIKHVPQGRCCSNINFKNLKKSSGRFRYKNVMIVTQCGVCYNKLRGKCGCMGAGYRNCTRVSRNVFEEMILELDFEHLDEGKWKGSVILDRCKGGTDVTLGDNLFIYLFQLQEVTHIPWPVGLTLSLPDQQCYISLTFLPQSPFSLTVTQNISSHSAAHGISLHPSGSYTTISSSLFPQIHHIYKVLFAM